MTARLSILIIFIAALSLQGMAQNVTPLTSVEAQKMITKDKKLVILDVRTPGEFSQGHVKGAVNIDVSQADAFDKYLKLDKNVTYIVICRTRNRSGVVTNYMSQKGFKAIYQVVDGIVGWNANNLPLGNN